MQLGWRGGGGLDVYGGGGSYSEDVLALSAIAGSSSASVVTVDVDVVVVVLHGDVTELSMFVEGSIFLMDVRFARLATRAASLTSSSADFPRYLN